MSASHMKDEQQAYQVGYDCLPMNFLDCHCHRCQRKYHEGRLDGNLARERELRKRERATR